MFDKLIKLIIISFKRIRIQWLKHRARVVYVAHGRELDEFGCGSTLACHIRPSIGRYKKKFNKIIDKLSALDPKAPKGRLK